MEKRLRNMAIINRKIQKPVHKFHNGNLIIAFNNHIFQFTTNPHEDFFESQDIWLALAENANIAKVLKI